MIVKAVLPVLPIEPLTGAVPLFWILNCKVAMCVTLPNLRAFGLTATLPATFLADLSAIGARPAIAAVAQSAQMTRTATVSGLARDCITDQARPARASYAHKRSAAGMVLYCFTRCL